MLISQKANIKARSEKQLIGITDMMLKTNSYEKYIKQTIRKRQKYFEIIKNRPCPAQGIIDKYNKVVNVFQNNQDRNVWFLLVTL